MPARKRSSTVAPKRRPYRRKAQRTEPAADGHARTKVAAVQVTPEGVINITYR